MSNVLRPNSLRFRLLASTALLVAIILPITAIALTSYYRVAVEQTFDQRLKVHLDNLVVVSLRQGREIDVQDGDAREGEIQGNEIPGRGDPQAANAQSTGPHKAKVAERKPIELGEPMFKRPFSGWYWQIRVHDGGQSSAVISDSLLDQRIASLPDGGAESADEKLRRGYVDGPEGRVLRVVEQQIIAGGDGAGERGERYTYTVAISSSELDGQVAQFRNMLLLALGLLGLGLLLAGWVQVRYVLAPLSVISRKLNEIRAGKADHLRGQFPAEIEPLQVELNALIRSNRDIVERARTHVGNLAHALKTPLSVIANEIDKAREKAGVREKGGAENRSREFAKKIGKQTRIMNDQVRHHLDRARMAAQVGIIGNSTKVAPITRSLSRTLQKIYREKQIKLVCECGGDLHFQGEKQDLEEMLGNLLENAFKWAGGEVHLSVAKSSGRQQGKSDKSFLVIRLMMMGRGCQRISGQGPCSEGKGWTRTCPVRGLVCLLLLISRTFMAVLFHLEDSRNGGLCAELLLPLAEA